MQSLLIAILKAVLQFLEGRKPKLLLSEITIMFIVKDDEPDEGFKINPGQATDAEGNPVDAGELTVRTESDDDSVVSIIPGADQFSGTVHFGAPGDAAITVTISNAAGTVLGKIGAQFHVTAGDPAAITGGTITFDGLTEA